MRLKETGGVAEKRHMYAETNFTKKGTKYSYKNQGGNRTRDWSKGWTPQLLQGKPLTDRNIFLFD